MPLVEPMKELYQEYLQDESRMKGIATSISFPQNIEEVREVLRICKETGETITIQGAKTGIVGGAVPNGNHILNTKQMQNIASVDEETLLVDAGVNLSTINGYILRNHPKMMFPVDPTEKTATIGGMIATGAKGPIGYEYGDISKYIKGITVVLSDGSERTITPEEADFLAMFRSEGMYGLIVQVQIALVPKPECIWGITFFFPEWQQVCGFADAVKTLRKYESATVVCGEIMDKQTIELIDGYKSNMSKIKGIGAIPEGNNHLIYVEIHAEIEEDLESLVEQLMEVAVEYDSDVEVAWAVSQPREIEMMHDYRHACGECANIYIERQKQNIPELYKLGMDITPVRSLSKTMVEYDLPDVPHILFGHGFAGHLHVNFLPETKEQFEAACAYMEEVSAKLYGMGANIWSEHGVGKRKKELFKALATREEKELVAQKKAYFDGNNVFAPNNIL